MEVESSYSSGKTEREQAGTSVPSDDAAYLLHRAAGGEP
jgi:hypothetical protein